MTISYSWLKDYLATDLTPTEAARVLTAAGLEIEAIETVEALPGGLAGVVVGRVEACEPHPDADKLKVTRVAVGAENGGVLQIVCGAPNVAAGQTVVVALVGAKLHPVGAEEVFAIKKSKIRGVESLGMICAEDELGIGVSHEGIIVLDKPFAVGTPAAEVFDLQSDTVFEVGLTPNRVDAASHYGVARDLAASLSLAAGRVIKAQLADVSAFKEGSGVVSVRVENPEAAPRYMGVVVENVTIAPSPEWLQKKLRAVGINPKNNVVDITNFVLHECGQPLHAFDLDQVEGKEVVVRTVEAGTKFTTLDGVERTLAADDLMICSAKKPMCLAGVFGGMESGVSEKTKNVFIESAYFEPGFVRRSAKRHGLSTDSSWRYERGADPQILPYALKRAALLMQELAGGRVATKVVDVCAEAICPFEVTIDTERINALIGKEIPAETVALILSALEIEVTRKEGSVWTLQVPRYRVDTQREADVAEDVLRIYGFNNVENPPFIKNVLTVGNRPTTDRLVDTVSTLLSSLGLNEVMSNSLTKASYYDAFSGDLSVAHRPRIINPLSNDLNVMRGTLLFNILEAVSLNANRRRSDIKIYEVGNCYFYDPEKTALEAYSQEQRIGIAVCGAWSAASWNSRVEASNFYSIKSLIEKVFCRLGLNFYEGVLSEKASPLFTQGFEYTIRGGKLFEMGEVATPLLDATDVKEVVYYAEINVAKLQKLVDTVRVKASELSKFQPVSRDLALLVDHSVPFDTLRAAAMKAEKKMLSSVALFDVYTGDKLPEGKKSYALNFVLEDATKTLTDAEIERAMGNITKALEAVGATVRA